VSKIATRKVSPVAAHDDGSARSSSGAPQLLSQIPGSLFTSPGFIVGIVAFELLYGLFLFAVMASSKRDRAAADAYVEAAPTPSPRIALVEPAERSTREPTKPEAAKPEPSRESSAPAPPAKEAAARPAAQETPKPAPSADKPAKKKKSGNRKKGARGSDKTVALAPSPRPADLAPRVQPTIAPLGPLIDPLRDCLVKADADGVTITVPPGLHVFNAQRDVDDAPRALADVTGDFMAEVKVPNEMRPGSEPVKGLNFTFQGAGLLLWQDRGNYVRFERTSSYGGDRFHRVFIESSKDGKPGKSSSRNVREGPISLRLERKGRDLVYSYSSDGKTWIKLEQSAVNYAPKLGIGISASNASTRILDARFTNFTLKR